MTKRSSCGRTEAAECETFDVARFDLTSDLSLPEHAHGRPAIAVGLAGRFELAQERNATSLGRGDLLTIPKDLKHRERVPHGTSRCLVIFGNGQDTLVGVDVRRIHSWAIAELGDLLAEAVGCQDTLGADATAHELLAMAHVGVADQAARSSDPGWLATIAEYLEDRFRSPPTLSELSREAGVSREHLARVFRRKTGLTVGQFVRFRRVLEGARCLRERAADLSEVAIRCGYSDQSHFTREFRRFLGTTPHAHRVRFHGTGGPHRGRQGPAGSSGSIPFKTR